MRVSNTDERQSVALQRDALLSAGVAERHLYQDRASGARDDRPGLKAVLVRKLLGVPYVVDDRVSGASQTSETIQSRTA